LAELDLDRAHGRARERLEEAVHREAPPLVAAPEVARADLPDEVAARPVVVRDAALAGVLHGARELHAAVDRLDGAGTERAEAHRRGVGDRGGPERLRTLAEAAQDPGRGARVERIVAGLARVRLAERERRVPEDDVARGLLQVVVGAKPEVVVLLLR